MIQFQSAPKPTPRFIYDALYSLNTRLILSAYEDDTTRAALMSKAEQECDAKLAEWGLCCELSRDGYVVKMKL